MKLSKNADSNKNGQKLIKLIWNKTEKETKLKNRIKN